MPSVDFHHVFKRASSFKKNQELNSSHRNKIKYSFASNPGLKQRKVCSQIARSFGHEIRNPLTNINLAVEQIKQETTLNENLELYLDMLQRNSLRISSMINEFIDSVVDKELNKEWCDLNTLIEECLMEINPQIQNLGFNFYWKKNVLPEIYIDKNKIKKAILNVLLNCLEASYCCKPVVLIKLKKLKKFYQLIIEDNGNGISPYDLNQVFDPFYTNKNNSKGLGLTYAEKILFFHHGNLKIYSNLNNGTKVKFLLPYS